MGVVNLETGAVCEDFRAYCPAGLYIANNPDSKLHASWWSPDAVGEAVLNARPFRGVHFHELTSDLVDQVGLNKVQFVTDIRFDDTVVVDTRNGIYKVGFAQCLVPFGSYLETPMPWCEDTVVSPVVEKIVFSYARLD